MSNRKEKDERGDSQQFTLALLQSNLVGEGRNTHLSLSADFPILHNLLYGFYLDFVFLFLLFLPAFRCLFSFFSYFLSVSPTFPSIPFTTFLRRS